MTGRCRNSQQIEHAAGLGGGQARMLASLPFVEPVRVGQPPQPAALPASSTVPGLTKITPIVSAERDCSWAV